MQFAKHIYWLNVKADPQVYVVVAKGKLYEENIAKTLKCEACEGVLQWLHVDVVQVDEVGLTQ